MYSALMLQLLKTCPLRRRRQAVQVVIVSARRLRVEIAQLPQPLAVVRQKSFNRRTAGLHERGAAL